MVCACKSIYIYIYISVLINENVWYYIRVFNLLITHVCYSINNEKWKWPNSGGGGNVLMVVSYTPKERVALFKILCRAWTSGLFGCGKCSESELQRQQQLRAVTGDNLSQLHSCFYAATFFIDWMVDFDTKSWFWQISKVYWGFFYSRNLFFFCAMS
jgi:hypothetical protein